MADAIIPADSNQDAKERLQTFRAVLDNSTRINRNLGLTFTALMFYILLIIASTTDLMLFLPESKVKLPILDVELPLLGFYSVVPFIILIFHFNLLVNLRQHQRKYRAWKEEADFQGDSKLTTDPFLVNMVEHLDSKGVLRWLVTGLVSVSVFFFPLINLIAMLYRFNDYHSFSISSTQFAVVTLDAVMILRFFKILFPTVKQRQNWFLRQFTWGNVLTFGGFCAASWYWFLAFYLHMQVSSIQAWSFLDRESIPKIDLTNEVGKIGQVADEYVLHYLNDSTDEKSAKGKAFKHFGKHLNLRGRDFRFGNFKGINLAGSNLQQANFNYAYLHRATLDAANLNSTTFHRAWLPGASLVEAKLDRTNFSFARMQEVRISKTTLYGVSFYAADLRNAQFFNLRSPLRTNLSFELASIYAGLFVRCNFYKAYFRGADLSRSHFVNVDFKNASLEAANLASVGFENSRIISSIFWAANLANVTFSKTNLSECRFQGAQGYLTKFYNSSIRNSKFRGTYLNLEIDQGLKVEELNWTASKKFWNSDIADSNSIPVWIEHLTRNPRREMMPRFLTAKASSEAFSFPNTGKDTLVNIDIKQFSALSCYNTLFLHDCFQNLLTEKELLQLQTEMCSQCPDELARYLNMVKRDPFDCAVASDPIVRN